MLSAVQTASVRVRVRVMGDRGRHQHHHHPAVGDVMKLLSKANDDLSLVQRRLDLEFQRMYPDNANPCKLVARIKKIQEELVLLKDLSQELLAEKQDLIDKARTLVGQRSSLQRLLSSSGLPLISESDNIAYTNLNQVIDEWAGQVSTKQGGEEDAAEDINRMLFSAIVHNN